jgi:hypothetical protein
MIVSKENKIILITPPKTGTYSITNYLHKYIDNKSNPLIRVKFPIYHLTLSEICYVFDIKVSELKDYRIIQCVRNPYMRLASAYFHQMKIINMKLSFEEFLEKIKELKYLLPHNLDEFYIKFYGDINHKYNSFKNNNWGGARFYYDQAWFNDLNVDNIKYFKLEDLSLDTTPLSTFLDIQTDVFPHINKNKISIDYKTLYTESSISIVDVLYKNDLKYFNYEF